MTDARERLTVRGAVWGIPVLSLALGGLFLLPGGPTDYVVGLTLSAVVAACCMAVGDIRTGLLPNRWTGPFALAGLLQVFVACAGTQRWFGVAAPCLLGAVLTTSLYLLLGLLGWVGFGDVKFAAGLALFVAIPAGWAGIYLFPLAMAFSALSRVLRWVAGAPQRPHSAHGPALASALATLMIAGCVAYN